MKEKYKILLGWISFVYVVAHTTMISIVTSPDQIMPEEAKDAVLPYISPIFNQRWSMFYPCPTVEGRIKMKIHYEDEIVDWIYPTEEDYKWYKILRFSHHGELTLLESNIVFWINRDLESMDWEVSDPNHKIKGDFTKTYSYHLVETYSKAYAVKLKGKEPIKIEVICELHDVVTDDKDDFVFPEYSWTK